MSVLYGLYRPDEGELLLDGQPVAIESPRQAIDLGIGMVHQHFMLVPVMTVAENIVLASEPRKGMLLDTKAAARRVRELSDRFGLSVDPDARVGDISVGQQQRVEILRALDRGAEVLILDEPTAVLTAQETAELFKILRTLTAEGKSIVFISHKLGEVLEIADRVSVLRRGKKVETVSAEGATEESLARMMVGRDVLFRVAKERSEPGPALLEVDSLEVADDRGLRAVRDVSLQVRAGEIVGIAGVDDNGQGELVETITGLRRPLAGTIRVDGQDVTGADVRGKLAAGIGHIAEDRHRRGLVLDFSLAENLCLRDYRRPPIAKHGLISPKRMNQRAAPLLEEYDVRGGSCDALALSLSGGNQQKVVIAREISEQPKVLVAAQPTRGLDVGAIEFVHRRLIEQRDAGRGVLLVSLELEEIRSLSDRVLVMYDGRIVGELAPEASEEEFGVAMLGGRREATSADEVRRGDERSEAE
jgi:general nucleoside transport system ATP-binding protein